MSVRGEVIMTYQEAKTKAKYGGYLHIAWEIGDGMWVGERLTPATLKQAMAFGKFLSLTQIKPCNWGSAGGKLYIRRIVFMSRLLSVDAISGVAFENIMSCGFGECPCIPNA